MRDRERALTENVLEASEIRWERGTASRCWSGTGLQGMEVPSQHFHFFKTPLKSWTFRTEVEPFPHSGTQLGVGGSHYLNDNSDIVFL